VLVQALQLVFQWLSLYLLVCYVGGCAGTTLFGQDEPRYFGTVRGSMLTLTQLTTLDDWTVLVRELADGQHAASGSGSVPPPAPHGDGNLPIWAFAVTWIIFTAYCGMLYVTAVFVRDLVIYANAGKEMAARICLGNKERLLLEIIEVFTAYDADASGTLGMEEIRMIMTMFESEEIQGRLQRAGIDLDDMRNAIVYSDADGSGEIDYEEFLNAVTTFDAESTRCDTLELQSRLRVLTHDHKVQHKEQTAALSAVARGLHATIADTVTRMNLKTVAFTERLALSTAKAGGAG